MKTLLHVRELGKAFRGYDREIYRIAGWFGWPAEPSHEHWVLRDINFSIQASEAVGIVGRNGAGKSTLLKMVAGTMRPSAGEVHVNGKVAAILELGMGFNPELTGRQNAYHSSGMMGLHRADVDELISDIAGFAELEDYFDQPIRVYSSGMQMRLAFAIATSVRPELLIIDEALAVGDTYFQHKCMERIRAFRRAGTALILVSHDKAAVQTLCDRAILINDGQVALDGRPESVLDYYNALIALREGEVIETNAVGDGRTQTISGSRKVVIESAMLQDGVGRSVDTVGTASEVILVVTIRSNMPAPRVVLGYAVKDRLGQTLYGTNTHYSGHVIENLADGELVKYRIRFPVMLGEGSYSIALSLSANESHLDENYEWRDLAVIFSVVNLDKQPFDGKLFMPGSVEVERLLP